VALYEALASPPCTLSWQRRRKKTRTNFSAVSRAVLVYPDTKLGKVIHVIKDPIVFSISLRLHVNIVDLVGDNKYITQNNHFFGKYVHFFG
jgi:hypothetical protein